MSTNLPTEHPDIVDRLNGLLGYFSAPADDIIADAIAEIERLRTVVDEWVREPDPDEVDQLDLHGLRDLTVRVQRRINELIAERRIDGPVNGTELGGETR